MGVARCVRWLLLFIVLPPFIYLGFFLKHPCGKHGYLVEWITHLLGDDDRGFSQLPAHHRLCLWVAGSTTTVPHNRLSYLHAARAMLTGVQSRYSALWQDSQSYWLELEVASYLQVAKVQFVSTGTAALVVAIQTLGIGPGDEVVVPTYTWIATAAAVTTAGAIPIMADIDETLGMSPDSLLTAISNRTKAVIVVHMRGVPCNVTAIKSIADSRGLFLIEDNAQSFGASIHGRMAGTFGVMGITSVNPTKTFQAGGQGGLVWLVPDNEYLKERMAWAVEHGLSSWGGLSNLPSYKRSFKDAQLSPSSEVPFFGHCFRAPSEWHAAFLRHELRHLDGTSERLRALKASFVERLAPRYRGVLQRVQDSGGDRSYTISLLLWSQDHASALRDFLEGQGVVTDVRSWSTHYLPYVTALMRKVSYHSSGFPWVTDKDKVPLELSQFRRSTGILNRSITILVSWYFTKGMMEFAADKVNEFLSDVGQDDYCNLTREAAL